MFAGKTTADGRSIRVVQASWMETNCNFYDNNGCYVSCAPFRESLNEVKRPQTITFKPGTYHTIVKTRFIIFISRFRHC
jgi:hypothetical protein